MIGGNSENSSIERLENGIDASSEIHDPSVRRRKNTDKHHENHDYVTFENTVEDVSHTHLSEDRDWVNSKIESISKIKSSWVVIVTLLYFIYLGYAMQYSLKGAIPLIVGTILLIFIFAGYYALKNVSKSSNKYWGKWKNSKGPLYLKYACL